MVNGIVLLQSFGSICLKYFTKVLLLVSTLLLSTAVLSAVELEKGHTYEGPLKLTAKSLGVGMGLPSRWKASLPTGGGLHLVKQESEMRIIIRSKEFKTRDALEYLNLPVQFEPGIMLFPSKRIVQLSPTKYRRSYRVNGIKAEAQVYVVLGTQKRATVMTGICAPHESTALQNSMLLIANSITFTQIKPLASAAGTLKKRIGGAHFVYYEKIAKHSEKREIWLCSDGRFVLREYRAVSSHTSSMVTDHQGKWHVDGKNLLLQFYDGSQTYISVMEKNKVIFFDDQRTYRMKNRVCR